jgi:hypothetical protein
MGAKAEVKRDSGLETPDFTSGTSKQAASLQQPFCILLVLTFGKLSASILPEVHRVATPLNVRHFAEHATWSA